MKQERNDTALSAFTLVELMIVLAIISAMVTIILPYAATSNESLSLEQQCLDIAQTVRYAINLAISTQKATRIVINPKNKTYSLEVAAGPYDRSFKPLDDNLTALRRIAEKINIYDIDGFDIDAGGYYLVFDPRRTWPDATISLAAMNTVKTIKIRAKQVKIESREF